MSSSLPPIGTKGKYVLKDPFATLIDPAISYTCGAIRRFKDIVNQGGVVQDQYYTLYGLSKDVYDRDVKNDEAIVTLLSDSTAPIYVPSSYIASFPSGDTVPYHRMVLSLDMGLIPDALDLTFLKSNLSNVVSDTVGVSVTINEHAAPYTETMTVAKDLELSSARDAKIKSRTTDYAQLLQLQTENARLKQTIALYESHYKG